MFSLAAPLKAETEKKDVKISIIWDLENMYMRSKWNFDSENTFKTGC